MTPHGRGLRPLAWRPESDQWRAAARGAGRALRRLVVAAKRRRRLSWPQIARQVGCSGRALRDLGRHAHQRSTLEAVRRWLSSPPPEGWDTAPAGAGRE